MGFFKKLFKAIPSAIGGAAQGFAVGGPYAAIAGGVAGAASSYFGGPSSAGGINATNIQGSGQRTGVEAREYYDEAFPGTNPWERLGAGNPMGNIVSAGVAARTQERNVNVQTKTQKQIVGQQVMSQNRVAQIQAGAHVQSSAYAARAQALGHAQGQPPGAAKAYMDSVITGSDPGITTPGAARVQAEAATRTSLANELNSQVNRHALALKRLEVDFKIGHALKSPEIAALADMAVKSFKEGRSRTDINADLKKHYDKLRAAGAAAHVISGVSDVVNKALGSVRGVKIPKKTSVRVQPQADVLSGKLDLRGKLGKKMAK